MSVTSQAMESDAGEARAAAHDDLPVLTIWREALLLPLTHLPLLIRIGGAPALFNFAATGAVALLTVNGILGAGGGYWVYLAILIVYTPFDVGWAQMAIEGADGVARRLPFTFGKTEAWYLAAAIIQQLVWVILAVPIILLLYAQRNFDRSLRFDAAAMLLALFVGIVVCLTRTLYVFPAIAAGRYRGIGVAWRQSKCSFERLALLEIIARAPWLMTIALIDRTVFPWSPAAWKLAVGAAEAILYLFAEATAIGAIALAWRWRVGGASAAA